MSSEVSAPASWESPACRCRPKSGTRTSQQPQCTTWRTPGAKSSTTLGEARIFLLFFLKRTHLKEARISTLGPLEFVAEGVGRNLQNTSWMLSCLPSTDASTAGKEVGRISLLLFPRRVRLKEFLQEDRGFLAKKQTSSFFCTFLGECTLTSGNYRKNIL